jgi:YesN/AraC family two-component response regulator
MENKRTGSIKIITKKSIKCITFGQYFFFKMKLYIQYMVSLRCKLIVISILRQLEIQYIAVEYGIVELYDDISVHQRELLTKKLRKSGLELLEDSQSGMIRKVKEVIAEMVHYLNELPEENVYEYINEKLGYDYNYVSKIFAEVKGVTIEYYLSCQKIERVKEFLLYDSLSIAEIAIKLKYRNVSHLSQQLKVFTGLPPVFFKNLKAKREFRNGGKRMM